MNAGDGDELCVARAAARGRAGGAGTDVVDASTIEAATPIVPLATMFHAAHSPGSRQAAGRARRPSGPRPTNGSSTANSRNGTSITSRRATPSSGMRADDARRATTSPAWTPKAQNCSFGVATTANTNRTRRQQLALRGEAVQRPLAGAPGGAGAPPPTSGQAGAGRRRRWPVAGGSGRRRRRTTTNVAATPTRPAMTVPSAVVVDPVGAVVGERAVGERVVAHVGVDALVGGDLLQPVRVGAGARGDEDDEQRRRRRGRRRRRRAVERRRRAAMSADLRARRAAAGPAPGTMPRAPYTRSGRIAITAPTARAVMMPSPMPIRTWTPIIAPATEPTDTASLPPRAYSTTNTIDGQHGGGERGEPGRRASTAGVVDARAACGCTRKTT